MSSAFSAIAESIDYPMFVVTTAVDGERSGCLVGFATQCSIHPVRYFVCVSKANHTWGVARRAQVLAVHVLRASDMDLAHIFGEETGDEVDKFAQCEWDDGPDGVPVLRRCDWFAGRIVTRVDGGDHVGHVLDVLEEGRAQRAHEPQLSFQAVRDFNPGHPA